MKCTSVTGAMVWLASAVAPALAPVNTATWKADSTQRWTVPLGAGVGRIFRFGPLPVNMQLAA